MSANRELYNKLVLILGIVKEEKDALIKNDALRVAELVDTKNLYVKELESFKGATYDDKIIEIIEEINNLQETNFLLTKQALSFQNTLLESIAQNLQDKTNTYSSKGNYQKINNINIYDQEV